MNNFAICGERVNLKPPHKKYIKVQSRKSMTISLNDHYSDYCSRLNR